MQVQVEGSFALLCSRLADCHVFELADEAGLHLAVLLVRGPVLLSATPAARMTCDWGLTHLTQYIQSCKLESHQQAATLSGEEGQARNLLQYAVIRQRLHSLARSASSRPH